MISRYYPVFTTPAAHEKHIHYLANKTYKLCNLIHLTSMILWTESIYSGLYKILLQKDFGIIYHTYLATEKLWGISYTQNHITAIHVALCVYWSKINHWSGYSPCTHTHTHTHSLTDMNTHINTYMFIKFTDISMVYKPSNNVVVH